MQRTAIAECPPSFDYFAESVVCAGPVVLSCPDGLTYDSVYVACTATPTCPPPAFGAYPDGTSLMCVADLADPCPAGFEYDESSPYLGAPACVAPRGCPEGSALGFSDSLCVAQPTAECPAGATYDQSSVGIDPGHACKIAPTFTCPPEFTIDSERSVCQAAPIKGRKR